MLVVVSQESNPHCTSVYQGFAGITFADVPLAKESHMAKLRINVGGNYTKAWILGTMDHQMPW